MARNDFSAAAIRNLDTHTLEKTAETLHDRIPGYSIGSLACASGALASLLMTGVWAAIGVGNVPTAGFAVGTASLIFGARALGRKFDTGLETLRIAERELGRRENPHARPRARPIPVMDAPAATIPAQPATAQAAIAKPAPAFVVPPRQPVERANVPAPRPPIQRPSRPAVWES